MATIPIYDQLTAYCDCGQFDEKDLADMVNVVSLMTCWQMHPCETFLKGDRVEVIDLPPCMECPFVFEPYYYPFDPDSFKFYLVTIDGVEETIEEIEGHYSTVEENFRLDLEMDCACMRRCGCDPIFKLKVEYTAGYEELPDCLLPVFCNLLSVIHSKNDCDCTDCGCESDSPESITYATGDVVTVALETYLGQVLVENYKTQLSMISLCRGRRRIWGFII